jgi:hypothetical protein
MLTVSSVSKFYTMLPLQKHKVQELRACWLVGSYEVASVRPAAARKTAMTCGWVV